MQLPDGRFIDVAGFELKAREVLVRRKAGHLCLVCD